MRIQSYCNQFTITIKPLTVDFAESHVKNRVKKGGSLPSIMIYIGASRDNFSRRKSRSRNFCDSDQKRDEVVPRKFSSY